MALSCLIAVVYVAGFLRQNAKLHGSPWKDVVHALQENARPGDELIFSAPYAQVPFDYFWRDRKPHLQEVGFPVSIYAYWNSQKEVKGWGSPIVTDPELASFVERTVQDGRSRAVWLLSYESYYYDPESRLPEDLKKRGTLTEILLPENPDDTSENAAPRHLYRFVPTSPSVEVTDGR